MQREELKFLKQTMVPKIMLWVLKIEAHNKVTLINVIKKLYILYIAKLSWIGNTSDRYG